MFMKFFKRDVSILKKCKYNIVGLDCADCANKIQEHLNNHPHFHNVSVNFSTSKISFETDYTSNIVRKVNQIISGIEPEAYLLNDDKKQASSMLVNVLRIIVAVALLLSTYFVDNALYDKMVIILVYVILVMRVLFNAIKQLLHFTINENFLITISTIGAYVIGEYMEGAMVLILYEIGKILENLAINHSRNSISHLLDIKPDYANLEDGRGWGEGSFGWCYFRG